MSVPFSQIPSTLLLDPDMTLSAVRVWHVVYTETLGRPGWDLSYQQIAEKIGTKRRQTAMEAVTLLLSKGWLVKVHQKDAAGDSAPNLYAVCREPFVRWNAQGGALDDTTPPGGGTQEGTTRDAPERTHQKNHLPEEQTPAGDGVIHQFALDAPPVPSHRETAGLLDEQFAQFWDAYPKRVDKGHARKMFVAALKKARFDDILAAVEKQKRTTWLNKERKYIPNPGTWLNGERWLDEPDQPRTSTTTYVRTESINYDGPSTYKAPKNRWT